MKVVEGNFGEAGKKTSEMLKMLYEESENLEKEGLKVKATVVYIIPDESLTVLSNEDSPESVLTHLAMANQSFVRCLLGD